MKWFAGVVAVVSIGGAVVAAPSLAGIADSPLPVLEAGKRTLHLYSVPGVRDSSCSGTYFDCTSMETATMRVGVELFPAAGGPALNDAAASSLDVAPGASVRFGTSTALDFGISSNLGGFGSSLGSARILSTSKKLACTAFVADRCNSPISFTSQLTIIAKTKQKAAN
jgi:hypothetical protein